MALEYYHYSQSYTARIYTIGNEKNLEHLKELKIPENEYQDDKIFKNVSQQIGLCRKYLQ